MKSLTVWHKCIQTALSVKQRGSSANTNKSMEVSMNADSDILETSTCIL